MKRSIAANTIVINKTNLSILFTTLIPNLDKSMRKIFFKINQASLSEFALKNTQPKQSKWNVINICIDCFNHTNLFILKILATFSRNAFVHIEKIR